jgi:hypothetical protein
MRLRRSAGAVVAASGRGSKPYCGQPTGRAPAIFLPVNKKLFAFKLKKIILYQRVRVSANIKNTAMSSLLRNIAPCCCGSLRIEETYDKATFEYHWICLDCNNTSEPSPIQNQAFLNWQMESIAWFYFFS